MFLARTAAGAELCEKPTEDLELEDMYRYLQRPRSLRRGVSDAGCVHLGCFPQICILLSPCGVVGPGWGTVWLHRLLFWGNGVELEGGRKEEKWEIPTPSSPFVAEHLLLLHWLLGRTTVVPDSI